MNYLKQIWNEFSTWKWIAFIIILFPYGWSIRVAIVANANHLQLPLNHWDVMFSCLSSPFLIIFLLLPFWLFFSGQLIIRNWDYTLLIRLKSFPKWILYNLVQITPMLLILQLLWIMISLLVTSSIPFENNWSTWGSTPVPLNTIIFTLQESGLSPWFIFFLQTTLISLFLVTLHVIAASVFARFPRMNVIFGIGLFLFIGAIISYKVFPSLPDQFMWGLVTNYSILSYSFVTFGSIFPPFLILIFVIIICFSLISLWSNGQFQHIAVFLTDHSRMVAYCVFCLVGIATSFTHSGMKVQTVWENLYYHFYGVSAGGFSLYVYVFFCIVFLGFVYLFQLKLSHILDGHIYYLMIRYKSYLRWFLHLMQRTIVQVIGLLLLLAVITVVVGLIQGRTLELHAAQHLSQLLPYVMYQFFVNGFLQLLNYILIVFIVSWVWTEATYSLIALGVLLVAGLPIINTHLLLPSGLNSLGYVTSNGTDLLHITIVLVVYLLIECGIIVFLFNKRKISL